MNRELTLEINMGLLDFIEKSPSLYHVIDNFKNMLLEEGFTQLDESRSWSLEKGGRYFVTRGGSTIIAFKVPEKDFANFQIVASHSDSPAFKLKVNPEIEKEGHYLCLNIEKYGGMIYAPWFDRPLSLAGRVVVKDGSRLSSRLVNIDRDLLVIPNLAIHMNRKVNDGFTYNPQKDMLPLLARVTECAEKDNLLVNLVANELGVEVGDILDFDLMLYDCERPCYVGLNNEFISSGRIDDLSMAHAAIMAVIEGTDEETTKIAAIFDNEETGSGTKQGAASPVLANIIRRINAVAGGTESDFFKAIAKSFMISADNAHAFHPNYAEKYDPTNHPSLGGGPVIKINANCKYMTDAHSAAIFRALCEEVGVPFQYFVNHSDVAGGSTLGNILTSQIDIEGVDVGNPLLAMHSVRELGSVFDHNAMTTVFVHFFS